MVETVLRTTSQTTKVKTIATGQGYEPPRVLTFVTQQAGLLVTKEFNKAIGECEARVQRIARDCRMRNRKFRDIEFDLENDKDNCLYGLFKQRNEEYNPADVHRVTQIFDSPHFFYKGKAGSNDIVQGQLEDCWFLSALATVSTAPGLIEKLCVAKDEEVGVYGFIFFRDNSWVTVVIDDMLYTRVPKYEELRPAEQELYHYDKEIYNKSARKGGKSLYFAKSGETGETWVPLIEKAYAKLHGNYSHIVGGFECDAMEDLTGGVSTVLQSKDVLDPDRFWEEELRRANIDRVFGCSFNSLTGTRNGYPGPKLTVQGLIGDHAYSVLRAVEVKRKRFVIVRNPWGKSEWTGRWSDGSKEWTTEWLEAMPLLGHVFGNDGQFVMEYKDWLECFGQIDRTILFDSSWMMSSQWLQVPVPPLPAAWSFGDVSFTFSLSGPTLAVLVLSQTDYRYFRDIAGRTRWSLDFVLVKEGVKEPFAEVAHSEFYLRSVSMEVNLPAGNYIVYVRLDRAVRQNIEVPESVDEWDVRKLGRVISARAKSQSIASNFKKESHSKYLPTDLSTLIEQDFADIEKKKAELDKPLVASTTNEHEKDDNSHGTVTTNTTVVTTETKTVVVKDAHDQANATTATATLQAGNASEDPSSKPEGAPASTATTAQTQDERIRTPAADSIVGSSTSTSTSTTAATSTGSTESDAVDVTISDGKIKVPYSDSNSVCVGFRVYTKLKDVPVVVVGRLKGDAATAAGASNGGSTTPTVPTTTAV